MQTRHGISIESVSLTEILLIFWNALPLIFMYDLCSIDIGPTNQVNKF